MGIVLARLGDAQAAVAYFRRAMALNPKLEEATKNLAAAHNEAGKKLESGGDLLGARSQFEEAVRADATIPEFHTNFGLALLNTGDPAKAIAQFKIAVALDPGNERLVAFVRALETSR